MHKFKDGNTIYFDVDDTLVMHYLNPPEELMKDILLIADPSGFNVTVLPHKPHIAALKMHFEKGDTVVVWSQGGSDWAESVVIALGLEDHVDAVLAKPTKYYDDLTFQQWAPRVTYLEQI